jgi:hypothetical protein
MNKEQHWEKRTKNLKELMIKKFGRELKKGDFLSFTNDWNESSSCKVVKVYGEYFNYPIVDVDNEDVVHLSVSDLKKGNYKLVS